MLSLAQRIDGWTTRIFARLTLRDPLPLFSPMAQKEDMAYCKDFCKKEHHSLKLVY